MDQLREVAGAGWLRLIRDEIPRRKEVGRVARMDRARSRGWRKLVGSERLGGSETRKEVVGPVVDPRRVAAQEGLVARLGFRVDLVIYSRWIFVRCIWSLRFRSGGGE